MTQFKVGQIVRIKESKRYACHPQFYDDCLKGMRITRVLDDQYLDTELLSTSNPAWKGDRTMRVRDLELFIDLVGYDELTNKILKGDKI